MLRFIARAAFERRRIRSGFVALLRRARRYASVARLAGASPRRPRCDAVFANRSTRRLSAAALLLMAVAGPAFPEEGPVPPAPAVRSLAFQVASPYLVSYEELEGLMSLRAGRPLTPEALRESIRGLSSKMIFREIAAYVREAGGEADVIFYLVPVPVVSDIEVRGLKKVPAAQVLAASKLRKGASLEGRDLTDAEEAILRALWRRGHTQAAVRVSTLCNVENGGGKVRIDITEGPPSVVKEFSMPGAVFFGPEVQAEMTGVRVGEVFNYDRWERGVRTLRQAYKKAGFLTVRIHEAELACGAEEGFCLSEPVEEGPRYEVVWTGNEAFSAARLESISGVFGEEESTESALPRDVRERILAFYREKDHVRAEVDVSVSEKEGGGRRLAIAVREGPAVHVTGIRFVGNRGIPEKILLRQMTTTERGTFFFLTGSGRFREEDWEADLSAVIGLYQREGYVRARVAGVDNVWDAKGGVTKIVRIEEGPRYRMKEIRLAGNHHLLRQEVLALMTNREGRFVDYGGLDRDQGAVAEHYRNLGYLDARVEARLDGAEDNTAVANLAIEEGPRYRRGTVIVRGTLLTHPGVVLRENTIAPGTPAGEKDLLAFQQAVFGTGLFKSVRVQRVKKPEEGIVDLVVEVEETLFFEVEYGGGYGTDTGVRGFVGARDRNLDGFGRSLAGNVFLSEKEQRIVWELREPWVLGNRLKWDGGVTGSYQRAERESFSLRRTSVVTRVDKTFFERSSVSLQYELSRDELFNVKPGAVISPEDQGHATFSMVRILVVVDLRDDPFNPRHGALNSATFELASAVLGSEVDYYKAVGQSSWYFPLLRRNTFVLSARAGFARPMGKTTEVPIQKRFFLGGRTTVRGFPEEKLGPLGQDGTPTGGDNMLNGNAEIRVPVGYGFLLAGFMDVGSVWLQKDPTRGVDLRKTAGTGFRYVTPIGPVSLDYAWKIDRRPGESASEWHFTIGSVF